MLKIICIEEHANDPGIGQAAVPAMMREAPYMALCQSERVASAPHDPSRPGQVAMAQALPLAGEIGSVRLKAMDEHGIAMQVISLGQPTQLVPAELVIGLARAANDRLAASVGAHPDRFAGFATLPWQHPQAAAAELTRAVEELGFKGALLMGRPSDAFLDDPRYAPVLKRLNELRVPLYVHPGVPLPAVNASYYEGFAPHVSAQAITGLSRTISETYRAQIWVTPSGMFDLPHFKFIHEVLGADRIIWSNDYPYLTLDGTRAFIESLPVSDDDREKIAFRNAEELLRLTGEGSRSA